jgi:hypothetical protein
MAINQTEFYDLAKEISDKNNIMNYLEIVAMNISLSPYNLILLYSQDKNMTTVCGEKAWAGFGRTVSDKAIVRKIIAPVFTKEKDKVTVDYDLVGVIDAKHTAGGAFKPKPSPRNLSDILVSVTNRSIEAVSPDMLKDPYGFGAEYNEERNVFYVSNKLSDQNRYVAIIRAYIRFHLAGLSIEDTLLSNAVAYVMLRQYGLGVKSFKGIMFKDLSAREPQEQYAFLCQVANISRNVLAILNTEFLTFEETILFNFVCGLQGKGEPNERIVGSQKREEICKALDKLMENIADDPVAKEVAAGLKQKLTNSSDDDMRRICTDTESKRFLPTYPPFEFSTKRLK